MRHGRSLSVLAVLALALLAVCDAAPAGTQTRLRMVSSHAAERAGSPGSHIRARAGSPGTASTGTVAATTGHSATTTGHSATTTGHSAATTGHSAATTGHSAATTGHSAATTGHSAATTRPSAATTRPSAATTRPSAATTTLYDATGLTPSQVTSEPVCGAANPGYASCDSELLVTRRRHAAVHPLAGPGSARPTASTCESATTSPQCSPLAYGPSWLQEAYDTTWLSANAGTGETVAIVDAYNDPNATSDLATFRSSWGLPAISTAACTASDIATNDSGTPCLVEVNENGQASPLPRSNSSWAGEESLDLDAVSSLCPNCNILYIEANSNSNADLEAGDAEAVRLGAKLISNSFAGPGEGDGDAFTDAEAATGDAGGTETFAATGDDGAYVDDGYSGQSSAEQVPYPASEPGITAVGGTSLALSATARGFGETVWSSSTGAAGSACSQFDAQPSWQASADTGCSGRAVADLSADADPDSGLEVYDSYGGGTGGSDWVYYGGTSLATPLTAAFTAITAANSGSAANSDGSLSAQWAYADASELNDITSGNNGTCPAGIAYAPAQVCDAGTGWDGPTGVGSISGAVVPGGPSLTMPPDDGIASTNGYSDLQALSYDGATFQGGAYPNGSATSVWWQYGTAAATGSGTDFDSASSSASQSIGAGTAPVDASATITGLSPSTTYYVEQCAQSSAGEICGNVMEFTTAAGPPAPQASNPTISATSLGYGGQISSSTPTWSPAPTSISYQWQESSDGSSWNSIGSATSSPAAYTIALGDSQQYIRIAITASDSGGSTTIYSNTLQVQDLTPVADGTPTLSDTSLGLDGVISVASTPSWSPGSPTVSYQWQESSDGSSWSSVGSATANPTTYTIAYADSSQFIRVAATASDAAGTTAAYSVALQVDDLAPTATGPATLDAASLGYGDSVGLSATPAWTPDSATVGYQWQESSDDNAWSDVADATGPTYTIGYGDSNQYLRVAVTGSANGLSTTVYSDSVQIPDLAPELVSSEPALADAGLALGDQISVAGTLSWSPAASTVTYQWQESSDGGTWNDAGDATSDPSPYTIALTDSGADVRLAITATNPAGSTTVYTSSAQIPVFAPEPSGTAVLSATSLGLGGVLSVSDPGWEPAADQVSYQWQESADGSTWADLGAASATPTTHVIAAADSLRYLRVMITATNAGGSSTVYTDQLEVENLTLQSSAAPTTGGSAQPAAANATIATAPALSGRASVGATIAIGGGSYANAGTVTVTFERCASTCTTVQRGSSTSYRLRAADAGHFMVATVNVAGIDGGTSAGASATGIIGPVISPLAGALRITSATATVRSSSHTQLLKVRRTILRSRTKGTKAGTYVLTLTRPARLKGALRAWDCVLAGSRIVSCSRTVSVARTARIRVVVAAGGRVELIALRQGAVAPAKGAVASAASAGGDDGAASQVCSTTDRTPETDGRPFKGVRIRRSADTMLVPRGAVTLTICSYNGMNATRATPQFGLSGIGATASPRTLARLTRELDAIHAFKPGAAHSCPNDDASEAILYFGYRSGPGDVVTVGMQGCNAVTNMAMQTISYPGGAAIPHHLAFGAAVIGQIAKLAQPVKGLKWATVAGHLRLCGGPAPSRCYIENYNGNDRVVVHASGDPWIAMAQVEHGRFRFHVAATGTYTIALYAGNTLVKQLQARVTARRTAKIVFPISIR